MYAQKNYPQKQGDGPHSIAQKGSLLVAICNLFMECFGREVDPVSLDRLFTARSLYLTGADGENDALGWHSVTAYDGTIACTQSVGEGDWPVATNKTLIKFADGSYHLIVNAGTQMIVDSWDGEIKSGVTMGQPAGWATFDLVQAENVPINPNASGPVPTETIHTDQPKTNLSFEVLAEPRTMYINKEGGANKWAFGNIRKIDDLVANGKAAQYESVTIVGIGKVDLGDTELGYYMDALAFGDYGITGNVTNTIGYAYADLTDGIYTPPEPVISPEPPRPEPEPQLPIPPPANPARPNGFKNSYRPFAEAEEYRLKRDVIVQEFDGRGRDRTLLAGSKHWIDGMFMVAGQWYGLPTGSHKLGKWYGIPDDALEATEDFLLPKFNIPEKQALHKRLSLNEHVDVGIARAAAQMERFKAYKKRFKI